MLRVMEDPETDPAVGEMIREAIQEHMQQQKMHLSDTTDSNKAMPGSEQSRSSMEISTDDDNMDELLDLLERIGQEGLNMKIELQRSYAREAYLQNEHSMEEDNMQGLLQQLTDEIQVLQDENRRMQKQIQDMRENRNSDKVSITNLMGTIENLRDTISSLEGGSSKKGTLDKNKSVSVGTMTERRILTNTPSQTNSSMSQMRDKIQQISPMCLEKGTQVFKQVFQRSTLTSTQGLIKTRNAGLQARPMSGRMNVGLQVGASSYRGKHIATQTNDVQTIDNMHDRLVDISNLPNRTASQDRPAKVQPVEHKHFSLLQQRINSLENTLNRAQTENSKLTERLKEVKENLNNAPQHLHELSNVDDENRRLQKHLATVKYEKDKLSEVGIYMIL